MYHIESDELSIETASSENQSRHDQAGDSQLGKQCLLKQQFNDI